MIETTFDGSRLTILINQPAKMNAITLGMWRSLEQVLTEVLGRPEISLICLRGAGQKAFCSGGDITEYEALSKSIDDTSTAYVGVRQVADLLRMMPMPTVAGIAGHCVGAGLVLATACDFRVCASNAVFKVTAVKRGLVYPVSSAAELIALVGLGKTRSILLRGQPLDATQALAAGLVDAIFGMFEFEHELDSFTDQLRMQSGDAYAASKRAIHHALQLAVENEEMRSLNLRSLQSDYFIASTKAFTSGRK